MQSRSSKYFRRKARAVRRSVAKAGTRSVGHVRTNIFERATNLRNVQRRVLLWTVLVFVLIGAAALQIVANRGAFTAVAAAPGGTYVEGTLGPLDTLNPILATTSADLSASRLLFSGLFSYDQTGVIRPDLATSIDTTDAKTFTIHLRDNATWSDGQPLTSDDVVYTIGLIQNAAVRSPLASSFIGVTVSAPDAHTVKMVLSSAYAPFEQSLTFGILPKHALVGTDPSSIRSSAFNLSPVTMGAFNLTSYRAQDADGNPVVYMSRNDNYYGNQAQVDRFQLHVYTAQSDLLNAYTQREVGAIAGVSSSTASEALKDRAHTKVTNALLDDGDYALFNTKSSIYSDSNLRAAIRKGTDVAALRSTVGGGVKALEGPVLASEVPGVADIKQDTGNVSAAKAALDSLGWKVGNDGIRSKDGQRLTMRLVAIDTPDYRIVTQVLQTQWRALGIDVQSVYQSSDTASEQVLIPRAYDVLVYELAIGADPDVYAYWHSSQATQSGLNFANYSSGIADDDLSSARAALDTQLRNRKYVAFEKQWLADTPAIALFQQSYHYVSGDSIAALPSGSTLVTPADRFATVNNWTVATNRVLQTP